MKKVLLLSSVLIAFCTVCFSQLPKVKWGEDFNLKKGSTDLQVVFSDKSGVYLQEGHIAVKSYFAIGMTTRASGSLIKLDKNLNEIYRNDFNKELKGKDFIQFFMLRDRMFLLASETNKRDRSLQILGAEVNKNSGELAGSWKPLTTFTKGGKKDDINFRITLNADSSSLVLVSAVEGKEKNEYQVQEFSESFSARSAPITITNEFDAETFQLQDLLYTTSKKIILVGRVYEFREGKKKKEKFREFSQYNIRLYDDKGQLQHEVSTNINGKWLLSAKVIQEKNRDLVLAAFYSNERKGKTIDGMLVQRIDPNTGATLVSAENKIDNSLLTSQDDGEEGEEDEKETRAERKERKAFDKIKDEGEAFSKFMRFRNIFHTADNSLIILAESFRQFIYTQMSYAAGPNGAGSSTMTTSTVFECGDLLMCKINAEGKFDWLQVLPKFQREVIGGAAPKQSETSFFQAQNRPFYAGLGAIQHNNNIQILFNDHTKNATISQAGVRPKTLRRFAKSGCFLLTVDESSGKISRKMLFSNANMPVAMPRLASVVSNTMYLIGKEDRLIGRSRIAVARIGF